MFHVKHDTEKSDEWYIPKSGLRWNPGAYATWQNKNVEDACDAVVVAKNSLADALAAAYPHGTAVEVVHHRGRFTGTVVGWDDEGSRVVVKNDRSGRVAKWWSAHVQPKDVSRETLTNARPRA